MEHVAPRETLRSAFDTIEAALQTFEAAARRHPIGSPELDAAATQLQRDWDTFLSEWRRVFDTPPPIDLPNIAQRTHRNAVSA